MMQISDVMPVSTELPGLLTTSAMSVAIIQWLKNAKWVPFMDQHTAGINRAVSWGAAFLAATGLHYNYDPNSGTLTIMNLTAMAIVHAMWDATKSYAFNWLIYNTSGIKTRAADVAAVAEGVPAKKVVGPGVAAAGAEMAAEPGPTKGV